MATRIQWEKDVAATAEFYPPEEWMQGSTVVTSATFGLFVSQSTAIVASGTAATVDSYSQAVSSVSRHDRTIDVASTSGLVLGRKYWICTDSGRGYYVEIADFDSDSVTLRAPARFAISSGSLSGARCSYALTTTHTATLYRNLRVEWSPVIGGVVYRTKLLADIVRWPYAIPFTEHDIEVHLPRFGEVVGEYGGWRGLKDSAEDAIGDRLRSQGVLPDLVRDPAALRTAAVAHVLSLQSVDNPDARTFWSSVYDRELSQFLEDPKQWYDEDGDMTPETADTDSGTSGELSGMPVTYMRIG